jgi:predicted RNA binding protein YcfA (HicA-like mRNA interferase family)
LRNNPRGVKFSDLETLLVRFGFVLVRTTGSHHIFRYSDENNIENLVIPVHGNNVKPEYVTEVIEALDRLFPQTEEDTDDGG